MSAPLFPENAPAGETPAVFLATIDGVDIWYDDLDPDLPYYVAERTRNNWLNRELSPHWSNPARSGYWNDKHPTVIDYLRAHQQLVS